MFLRIACHMTLTQVTQLSDRVKNLTGQIFGRLTVIECAGKTTTYFWKCKCTCGKITTVVGTSLTRGSTQSCGCLLAEGNNNRKHGMVRSTEYEIWQGILQRCHNSNHRVYKNYGGRGIRVCKRWHQFKNFLADMGRRPEGLSLDRKNNDKGYSLENCRWATRQQQARNTRRSRYFTHEGIRLRLSDWAAKAGMSCQAFRYRLIKGWPFDKALSTPVGGAF